MYPSFGSISHHRILCGFGHSMAKIMPCTEAALAIEMKLVCNKTRKPLFWMDPDLPPWETGVRYSWKSTSTATPQIQTSLLGRPGCGTLKKNGTYATLLIQTSLLGRPGCGTWSEACQRLTLDPDLPPWETGVRYLNVLARSSSPQIQTSLLRESKYSRRAQARRFFLYLP